LQFLQAIIKMQVSPQPLSSCLLYGFDREKKACCISQVSRLSPGSASHYSVCPWLLDDVSKPVRRPESSMPGSAGSVKKESGHG